MIRVTQGHEKGVGLEIFLKAFLCLDSASQKQFTLYCDQSTLKATLEGIKLPYKFGDEKVTVLKADLNLKTIKGDLPETSLALYAGIEAMRDHDVLLTLPSSKDQIVSENLKPYKGHTDLFRSLYPNNEIIMSFVSPRLNVALLTDHVALGEVESYLSFENYASAIIESVKGFRGIRNIQKVYVAGVNPHCGEGGIISKFDPDLQSSLDSLKENTANTEIIGLLPGDTILFNQIEKDSLFIFSYHDQGLAPFKLMNGLTGINLTLGLPYRRVSVDHGTAFDLYGQNKANYQGMLYLLNEILTWE